MLWFLGQIAKEPPELFSASGPKVSVCSGTEVCRYQWHGEHGASLTRNVMYHFVATYAAFQMPWFPGTFLQFPVRQWQTTPCLDYKCISVGVNEPV